MKLSFPYMGCVTAYKKIFEAFGHEIIMPKKPTQSTIDLGVKYSPEFVCFPFKVMLGTYIECCEAGAEVIISSGGHGPCRAGYYGELHQRLLHEMGYNVEIIIFDAIFRDYKDFWRKVMLVKNNTPMIKALYKGLLTFKLLYQMDKYEKQLKILRAYEKNRGDFNLVWNKIIKMYDECKNFKQLKNAKKEAKRMLSEVPVRHVEEKDRMKVGVIGEIYVAMVSSANMDIEQSLNNLGIEVENVHYISNWLTHNAIPGWIKISKSRRVIEKAKRYKVLNCGGHDMENIGWVIDFKERNFDGVVHLMPFACLPELINLSMLPNISKELDIPVLSLSLDEQLGAAHNMTRVEAFVDLMNSRKEKSVKTESKVYIPEYRPMVVEKGLQTAGKNGHTGG